jgi:polyisoprenoid-binding protein YceI
LAPAPPDPALLGDPPAAALALLAIDPPAPPGWELHATNKQRAAPARANGRPIPDRSAALKVASRVGRMLVTRPRGSEATRERESEAEGDWGWGWGTWSTGWTNFCIAIQSESGGAKRISSIFREGEQRSIAPEDEETKTPAAARVPCFMPRHRLLSYLLLPAAMGCGLPAFEVPTVRSRLALVAPQAVEAPPEEARRFAIRPEGSLLEVFVKDLVTGPHTLTFTRYRGSLVPEETGGTGTLTLDVDLESVHTDSESVTSIIKWELLQVERYPHARITATLRPAGDGGERTVEGTVLLHGVRRGLRFTGRLRHRGERWYLSGEFEMSRIAHGIHRAPNLDWMISDDFLVKIDLLATPETVSVEMGGASGAGQPRGDEGSLRRDWRL